MKKVLLKIDGMTCSACSTGLEKYLNKQDGVKATVNLVMNNASIEFDDKKYNISDLEKFVEKAGFESLGIDNFEKEQKTKSYDKYKLGGITVISLLILYISMAHMVNLPAILFLDKMRFPLNYAIALWILSTIVIILGKDLIRNGIKNLIHKSPNMDTLVTIGVVSSYIYSLFGTYMILKGKVSFVEYLYFESSAIVIFFIKIGKYIENKNKDKTKAAISGLMTITPNKAVVERENKTGEKEEIDVTIDEIKKGDIVVCRPGEKIAVDGVIVDGQTHINEAFITGESVPVKREKGAKVIAGSINYEGNIKYKAEKIGKDSTVSEIVRLVVEATNTKAPIAKIADTISGYFVPVVIVIAIISFFGWLFVSKNFSMAINIFVSILVVACPCSLGLATPLAIVISSGVASKRGILIKNSEALENAHKVKTVVFDKTGTLTKGTLTVSKIYNYSNLDEAHLMQAIASIEQKSEHPIARAIVEYVQGKNTEFEKHDKKKNTDLYKIVDFKAISGLGVSAILNNEQYLIGNKKLMLENNVELNDNNEAGELEIVSKIDENEIEIRNKVESNKIDNSNKIELNETKIRNKVESNEAELTDKGNSILFVAINNKLVALIGVKDVVKYNAKEVVRKIQENNIRVVMLTGDNEKTAKYIANEIGIDEVIANVKPKEKSDTIKKLKQDGLVMMCGDGINDSVSLVTADIGVSVSSGTDIAMDSSNIILMNDNLDKINDLIYISKKTITNIKQNLFWAFFYNVCMIPVAMGVFSGLGIVLNPMLAALAMTFSSLTVVFNSCRLLRPGKLK